MGNKHLLKTWPEYFKEVVAGKKTFEVRKDDRNFQVGDTLELLEFDPDKALKATEGLDPQCTGFTGKSITKEITYKLQGGYFGVEKGFCVLGLR